MLAIAGNTIFVLDPTHTERLFGKIISFACSVCTPNIVCVHFSFCFWNVVFWVIRASCMYTTMTMFLLFGICCFVSHKTFDCFTKLHKISWYIETNIENLFVIIFGIVIFIAINQSHRVKANKIHHGCRTEKTNGHWRPSVRANENWLQVGQSELMVEKIWFGTSFCWAG